MAGAEAASSSELIINSSGNTKKIPLLLTGLAGLDGSPARDGAVHAREVHGILLGQANRLNVVGIANGRFEDNQSQIVVHVLALPKVLVDVHVLDENLDLGLLIDLRVVVPEADEIGPLREAHETVGGRQDMETRN